jgi:hypothetical protein
VPQRDVFHDTVKRILIADGWTITHDPLVLPFGRRNVYVDLGAELPLGAEKEGRRIAVEVKSFLGVSDLRDLEQALGQFALYRFLLARDEPERVLFLAITRAARENLFEDAVGRELVASEKLRLLVFDPETERLLEWI